MMKIKILALISCLAAAAGPAFTAEIEPAGPCDLDSYTIMSDLVSSEYLPDFGLIVINPVTETWCLSADLNVLFDSWPDLKKETADSLIVRNSRAPAAIEDKFDIDAKTLLVTKSEYLESLKDSNAPDWDNFDRTFPDAQGYLTFSRVGFDADCTQALVIYSNAYRCSGTQSFPSNRKIAYFKKTGETWRLVGISRNIGTLN